MRDRPAAMTDTDVGATATLCIGGWRCDGADGSYPVHNPARPAQVVGDAPAASTDQLDAAVAAARTAVAEWADRPVADRVEAITAAATEAAAYAESVDLATRYTREHGKVRSEAAFEFAAAPAIAAMLGAMADDALAPEAIEAPAA